MTDPDTPINKEKNHWLVVNIPGNKVSEGEVKRLYKIMKIKDINLLKANKNFIFTF